MYSLETLSRIDFEITSHCNSKCPQCPRYDMKGHVRRDLDVRHLELDLINKLPIEKMKMLKTIYLAGNFGDPLMHPDLDSIIDFFNLQEVNISTNASLRSEEWWQNLGNKKNVNVIFCIDGIGKTHELYRRNTSYKKIIQNAEQFIKAGGTADWQFIVFKHNQHQIEEANTLAREMGFRSIDFIYSDRFDTNNTWKVYDEGNYLYDLEKPSDQTTLREHLNAGTGEKWWKKMYENKQDITCIWSKTKKLYIHSDGLVYPCCMLGSTQAGKTIEKMLMRKLIQDFKKIDLHHADLDQILASDTYTKRLPDSFNGKPFPHPVCIENCNKSTGKDALSYLNKFKKNKLSKIPDSFHLWNLKK